MTSKVGEVRFHGLAEREMVAFPVAHLHRLHPREDARVAHGEAVRRVVMERVAAGLCLQHQGEGRVACDVDPGNVVHLDGD